MTGRLIQLSGVVVDLVCSVEHMPSSGQEVETPYLRAEAGGGFNAMAAASRMGAEVIYAGTVGTGPFADLALNAMLADRISLLSDQRQPMEQGSCVAITESNGERSFISHHGAERHVTREHLNAVQAKADDVLLLTGYSMYKSMSASAFVPWLNTLERGPILLFDPGPMIAQIPMAARNAAFDRADWLSLNLEEARLATRLESAADAAQHLSCNRQGAIVRAGADGCWLSEQGKKSSHIPAVRVKAVDTNGAGDAHNGAFIAALLFGHAPFEAATIANAAAALSTLKTGPATSPDFDTIKQLLQKNGIVLPPSAQALNQNKGREPAQSVRH
jgi:sugar/nucleoside kinase (ribokinase family)